MYSHRKCFNEHPIFQRETRLGCQPHAGLWHDKFLREQESKDDLARNQGESEGKKKQSFRAILVGEVAELPEPKGYQKFYERWEKELQAQQAQGTKRFYATAKGRLIVGLGVESVLETGIALHHTYGVPYIPGSALKGLTASYMARIREKLKPADEQSNYEQICQAYKFIFGDTDDAGYVTFFDALYQPGSGHKGQALYPDIITVHHQKYYQHGSNDAPADWDSPIPVPFLSATGTYLVALAAPDLEPKWLTITASLLGAALKSMGIGAKTSSGYGRMELSDEQGNPVTLITKSPEASQPEIIQELATPIEPIRPELPQFKEGQEIKGSVVPLIEELRRRIPPEIKAVLQYESFLTTDVVIAISEEEAQNWNPGNTRNCVFLREEVHNNLTVLICKPRIKKDKKKK